MTLLQIPAAHVSQVDITLLQSQPVESRSRVVSAASCSESSNHKTDVPC